MYETNKQPPLSRPGFWRRLCRHAAIAVGLILISLGVGIAGYCGFEHLSLLDGFLNSAMLLGGMGPVDMPKTDGGKIFAGLYALYSGLLILVTAGVVLSPVLHRILHKFHWARDPKE